MHFPKNSVSFLVCSRNYLVFSILQVYSFRLQLYYTCVAKG